MGFCTPEQTEAFLRDVPRFEEMLIEDGILLRKYYLSVSQQEQHKRFLARSLNPTKRWKVSPVDIAAVDRFDDYTAAKELMFERTHTVVSPWFQVDANVKRLARLDLISHLLSTIPYNDVEPPAVPIPPLRPATWAASRSATPITVPAGSYREFLAE
jgi:polyphosphate kinase 2 (PPK2 family)